MLALRYEGFDPEFRRAARANKLVAQTGRLREAMKGQENLAELLTMCVVMIVLSILGIIGGVSRDLRGTLDGLLILFVSLMILLISVLLLLSLAKKEGWIGKHHQGDGAPVGN